HIIFGLSPAGARYLVTVHTAAYDWVERMKQPGAFAHYMNYPFRLANLLYALLNHLVDSYQQVLQSMDEFLGDLEDAARDGAQSWRAPERIRTLIAEARELDAAALKARRKVPVAFKVTSNGLQSEQDYLQVLIFRTKRALSRMRDVMLPEANAVRELVAHAKYHASKSGEADQQKLVDQRLAGYFSDLANHLDVLDEML